MLFPEAVEHRWESRSLLTQLEIARAPGERGRSHDWSAEDLHGALADVGFTEFEVLSPGRGRLPWLVRARLKQDGGQPSLAIQVGKVAIDMERAIAKRKLVNLEAVRLNPVSERLNTGTPNGLLDYTPCFFKSLVEADSELTLLGVRSESDKNLKNKRKKRKRKKQDVAEVTVRRNEQEPIGPEEALSPKDRLTRRHYVRRCIPRFRFRWFGCVLVAVFPVSVSGGVCPRAPPAAWMH